MAKTYNGVNNSVDGPRANVGAPSGKPIRNRGPGDHTRGERPDTSSSRNSGTGYADGNVRKTVKQPGGTSSTGR